MGGKKEQLLSRFLFMLWEKGCSVFDGNGCTATNHITAELSTELFFSPKTKKLENSWSCAIQKKHEIWNTDPRAAMQHEGKDERKRGRMLIELNKKERKTYAVICLLTQQSWRCILWATDKQTGSGPLLSDRARLSRPAGGGGAVRVPFSITPHWATLKTPKEIQQNKTRAPGGSNSEADFWKCLWRV